MVCRVVVENPTQLPHALQTIHDSNDAEVSVTLCIYKPLEDKDIESHLENDAHPLGARFLEPLYHTWALALREVEIKPLIQVAHVIFDITRPQPQILNLMQYEARGLARLSALLRHRLHPADATIEGAPCWCILRECEKHTAALPKGRSWPLTRASHHGSRGTPSKKESLCLKLAREHWDDEHWSILESI